MCADETLRIDVRSQKWFGGSYGNSVSHVGWRIGVVLSLCHGVYRYLSHGRWRGEGGVVIGDWLTRLWPSSTR